MGLKTYLLPSEIHMKVDREELRRKLSECIEEAARKL
jgi:predicted nuclease with TOPRIM domain